MHTKDGARSPFHNRQSAAAGRDVSRCSLPMATALSEGVSSTLEPQRSFSGRGGDRTWQQDNVSIEAFTARVEAAAVA